MQLTLFTEYSFKVLMYLALNRNSLATIHEIASACRASKNHIVKVIGNLVHSGFIRSERGRYGGLRIAREPVEINLGDVARNVGMNLDYVECFDMSGRVCPFEANCKLKHVISDARRNYMATLDKYTLDQIL